MTTMVDIKPFVVRYKAGTDKSILPGIHGKFETKAKALVAAQKCAAFFGVTRKNADGMWIGKAIIGITTDMEALEKQESVRHGNMSPLEGGEDELPQDVNIDTELDDLRAENERLRAALEDRECGAPSDTDEQPTVKRGKLKKSLSTSSTEE